MFDVSEEELGKICDGQDFNLDRGAFSKGQVEEVLWAIVEMKSLEEREDEDSEEDGVEAEGLEKITEGDKQGDKGRAIEGFGASKRKV